MVVVMVNNDSHEFNEKEYSSTQQLVRNILSIDLKSRNSDKWLCYNVYQIIAKANGNKVFIPFELFEKFPSFETISRVRRKIQHKDGEFKPTEPEVINRRDSRERFVRNWAVE